MSLWRGTNEILRLPVANGALITRPSAQHDEHNAALGSEFTEAHFLIIESWKGDVGGLDAHFRYFRSAERARRQQGGQPNTRDTEPS